MGWRRRFALWGLAVAMGTGAAQPLAADTLQRVRDTGEFRIGFRADASPHSFTDAAGQPAGYIVELCREVAGAVKRSTGVANLAIKYVQVTAENRFEAVRDGRIDVLCEATSMSIDRRRIVNFSMPTFVDGAGMLFQKGREVERFEDLAGKRVGVLAGTTSAEVLRSTLEQLKIRADVVTVKNHGEGAMMLGSGKLDVYFGDRSILSALRLRNDAPPNLQLARRYFSYETYGLAMQRGDDEFRFLVDRTLARLYRDGLVENWVEKAFGAPPDELLRLMIAINAIPD